MSEYTPWMKHLESGRIVGDGLTDYINSQAVRTALNIPTDVQAFHLCMGDELQYHPLAEGSKWIYSVLRRKLKIMFYSGDTDGALPTSGSKAWIQSLHWKKTEDTRQWYTDGQVSGYVEQYDGLDFVTVHGTGHMAPGWKPKQVTTMITAWIHNEDF